MTLKEGGRPRIPRLALALLAVLLLSALAGVLPGPAESLRDRLGIGDAGEEVDPTRIPPCEPSADGVHLPAGPPAPSSPAWRREADSPLARDEARAAVVDGRAYVVGGHLRVGGQHPWRRWSSDAVLVFEPDRRRYSRAPDLPIPLDHAGVAAHDGSVYVVGGFSNGKAVDRLWRYTPGEDGWEELAPMRTARGALDAAVVGDRLYALGGAPPTTPNFGATPYGTVEVFDFETERWSEGPEMPTPRHHFAVAVLDGKLYAVGGRRPTEDGLNFGLTTAERFDPATGSWERLAPLPQGVSGLATVAAGGELIALAGANEPRRWVTPANWAFDPERGSWRRLPDLNRARHAHAAAAIGGRSYVIEGAPCAGYGQTPAVESLPVP